MNQDYLLPTNDIRENIKLDVIDILEDSFNELINLHDLLRASYDVGDDGEIIQEIRPLNSIQFEVSEVNVYNNLEENILDIIDNARNSLNIKDKLFDITLVQYGDKSYIVFVRRNQYCCFYCFADYIMIK